MTNPVYYVKFVRGLTDAWNQLANKNDDTLYFIYDRTNSTEGKLYLGNKLISGGNGSDTVSLNSIEDIEINGSPIKGQLLVYDDTSGKWINESLENIIAENLGIMTGATEQEDGASGLVPAPKAGEQDKFLRGDGTWATPVTFDSAVFDVNNNGEVILKGFDGNIPSGSIPITNEDGEITWTSVSVPQLTREVVNDLSSLESLVENGQADTNTIYMVRNGSEDSNDLYTEYIVIEQDNVQHLEALGTITNTVDFEGFETRVGNLEDLLGAIRNEETQEVESLGLVSRVENLEIFQAKVGDLNSLLENNETLVNRIDTLTTQINDIDGRLAWQELENN